MEIISRNQLKGTFIYQLREGEQTFQAESVFGEDKPRSRVIVELKKTLEERLKESGRLENPAFIKYAGIDQLEGEYCFFQERSQSLRLEAQELKPLPAYLEVEDPSVEAVIDWLITLAGVAREAEAEKIQWPGFNLEAIRIAAGGELYQIDPGVIAAVSQYRPRYDKALIPELYQPPEVIRGEDWDERSRLYSLGVIGYYLLTGKSPFTAGDKADLIDLILNSRIVEPRYYNNQLSAELSQLILDLLAGKRADRPESMEALLEELTRLKKEKLLRAGQQEVEAARSRSNRVIDAARRKQGVRSFIRKRWGVMAATAVIITMVLMTFIMDGNVPVITGETTPRQVVEYFYQSIDRKDIMLLDETNTVRLNRLEKMVTENYVMEKMRSLYPDVRITEDSSPDGTSADSPDDITIDKNRLFGIANLQLSQLEDGPQPLFRAEYIFYLNLPAGEALTEENLPGETERTEIAAKDGDPRLITREIAMIDELKLEDIEGCWQIVEIRGSIEKLINGEMEEFIP